MNEINQTPESSIAVTGASGHLGRLDDVSAIKPIFPNSFFANGFVRNIAYGGMRESIDA